MRLMNKSIEELLDLEEELKETKSEEDGSIFSLISVYETLYRKISSEENHEYGASLNKIKAQLIHYLVQYGTYLKTVFQRDDDAAERNLRKATRYEKNLPIAYYRLGFLQYKKENYSDALQYFQAAIHSQETCKDTKYVLSSQQLYNGHLYLANCGLFIAKEAQETLSKLEHDANVEAVPQYITSPYYQLILDNEDYLERHAYQITTVDGTRYGTKDHCEDMLEKMGTIILDLTGRRNLIVFNKKETTLSKNQTEMLRYFLLKSNWEKPLTKHDFYDLYANTKHREEIPTNTYIQNVTRLRGKLTGIGIGISVLENSSGARETGYYYNQFYPFVMMNRSDESFILNE